VTIADTDVLIDFLAGKGEAETVERLIRLGTLETTAIMRFELLSGAKNERQLDRILSLLAGLRTLPLDELAADKASEIRKTLESSGNSIGMADSLIAGIVTSSGGVLFTRNRRHFERVPGPQLF
jgi:hypothetical protein